MNDQEYAAKLEEAKTAIHGEPWMCSFSVALAEGESILDYSSTRRRIHGPAQVVTHVYADGGISQKVLEV